MIGVQERPSVLPSLENLQAQTAAQIAGLLLQKQKLGDVSTQVASLIARYNAQKSYFGRAAYWYGEQVWWLQLTLSILAAGIAILLYIPTIISIAISLATSFLLIQHHHIAQQRDQLISRDLNAQNEAVQTMMQDLETAKIGLEEKLLVLCKMNQTLGDENMRLRNTVSVVKAEVETYKSLSEEQVRTIEDLKEKETRLNTQLDELQTHLTQYKELVEHGASTFTQNNERFTQLTAQLQTDSKKLRECTADIVSSSRIMGGVILSV